MLTIENPHKIIGRKIPIYASNWMGRIKDVYYMIDDTYVFEVETNTTDYLNQKKIRIILDRKRPIGILATQDAWELCYETHNGSNCYEVELVSTEMVRDMDRFGVALGGFVDRIMNSK